MPKQKIDGRFCYYCTKERIAKGLQPRRATQIHETFIDSKKHRELYGDLIDDPRNAFPVCFHCNTGHANVEVIDEQEFCKRLDLIPRSKEAQIRRLREAQYK